MVINAEACYLEHVCIAVMGVLHHHRLDSRQSVRDTVLVFVAYGLCETEQRSSTSNLHTYINQNMLCRKNTSDIHSNILTVNNR